MSNIAIIGAGHNGLVCACYLAREGHTVTVYEQAERPGGCTTTEEIHPGFHYNVGAIELEGVVHSGIVEELELEAHGLEMLRMDHLLSGWVGENALHLVRDKKAVYQYLANTFGPEARDEWEAFVSFSDAIMTMLGTFQHVKAPDTGGIGHLMGKIGALGQDNERIIQTMFAPSVSVLDEWLTTPLLKASALAYSTHPQLPPWIPGTGPLACLLASSHSGQGMRPKGGTGKLIDALVNRLESLGGKVVCGKGVSTLTTSGGRVTGLAFTDGSEAAADRVVSTIDIKRLARMLPDDAIPSTFAKASRRAHCGLYNVGEVKLDMALDSVPQFVNDSADCAGSLKYLMPEADSYITAFRTICGGHLPERPPLMVGVPTLDDPSMAPPGKAVLWVSAFVPATFANGRTWPEANSDAAEAVLKSLEQFTPGVREKILHMEVTGPHEWEQRTGNPAGNPNHIDMTVDQCFSFRPGIGLDQYLSPIDGLVLSGAGTHPGGGVHGMPGKLAASAVLNEGKSTRKKGPSLITLAKAYFQLKKAIGR